MRVFLTGATGFIGSAIVRELLSAGHQVLGLARSDAAAQTLVANGAEVHRGDLENHDSLRTGAAASDGVIHTGFIHDFSRHKEVCETDRHVIATLSDALAGSARPLVVTSGTALISAGRIATEHDRPQRNAIAFPRVATEEAAYEAHAQGVHVSVVRLSPAIHGDGDLGFVRTLIAIARRTGVSAYAGAGRNRWAAVHRLDAARLFRLALERGNSGSRFHGVAEEGVTFRDIAECIGRRLNLPVVAKSRDELFHHFAWFAHFVDIDCPASSLLTQEWLGWRPAHASLVEDLQQGFF